MMKLTQLANSGNTPCFRPLNRRTSGVRIEWTDRPSGIILSYPTSRAERMETGTQAGRKTILILLSLFVIAHLGHHIVSSLLTPLLPFIRDDFALSYTQTGWLVSAFTLTYGIAQLPGGWLLNHLGPRRLIAVGISGVALCGLLMGFSVNYLMLLVLLIVMGIMGGGYHPSASTLISSAVDEKMRGRALGIHQIGGTGSFFLAPLIAVAISRAIGWRGSFISLSIPTFAYGLIFFFLLSRFGFEKARAGNGSIEPIDEKDRGMRIGTIIPVMILAVCVQVFIYSSLSFIPLYVVDHFDGSKEVAAALLSVANSAGLWAGPLAGYLSDRLGRTPIVLFTGILAGPLIYLLSHASLGVSISVLLLLLGMTQYMSMPVTEAFLLTYLPKRTRSTMLGTYYFASRGGPGLLAPLMGYLIDNHSFGAAYLAAGAGMGLIGVVSTVIIVLNRDWYK
jgi:MFS family permease